MPDDEAPHIAEMRGVRPRLLSGAGILSGANIIRLGIQLISIPLLARLLGPYPIGIMAIAMPLILIAGLLCDLGFSGVVIRENGIEVESTAFWMGIAASIFFSAVLLASEGILTRVIHPDIGPILLALTVLLPLSALTAVPIARLTREGSLISFALADVLGVVLGLVVAIYLALTGWGVWALVAQQIAVAVARLVVFYATSRFVPAIHFQIAAARRLARNGLEFTSYNLLSLASKNVDNLLVGVLLGARPAGGYAMSYQVVRMPDSVLSGPLYMAISGKLASFDAKHIIARRLYAACGRVLAAAIVPAMVGLALLAQPIVDTLFGPQWSSIGPALASLAPAGLFQSLNVMNLAFLTGLGEYRALRLLGLAMASGTAAGAAFGCRWGLEGAGWGVSIAAMLNFALASIIVSRKIGLGLAPPFAFLLKTVPATALMVPVVLYSLRVGPPVGHPLFLLPLPITAGALTYVMTYLATGGRTLFNDVDELRKLR